VPKLDLKTKKILTHLDKKHIFWLVSIPNGINVFNKIKDFSQANDLPYKSDSFDISL